MEIEITAPDTTRFRCRHVFTDGRRCGSPALRNENFCYYHHTSRRPIQDTPTRKRREATFALPAPADLVERSGIQHTIGLVLSRIATNNLDPRRAGLLLYGLQIASLNLGKQEPAPKVIESVEEITIDPEHGPLATPTEYVAPYKRTIRLPDILEFLNQDEDHDYEGEDDNEEEDDEEEDDNEEEEQDDPE